MRILFLILCGILYVIGYLFFGWNYHETSVYVCIYLWPYLCACSTLPITFGSICKILYGIKRSLFTYVLPCAVAYSLIMFDLANRFITHYESCYGNNIDRMFYGCQNELKEIARLCNTDYATVNMSIYVILFLIIIKVNTVLGALAVFPFGKRKYAINPK